MNKQFTPPHIDNHRLHVFDAVRGFSMFLVVYAHVMLCFDLYGSVTIPGDIFISFRMPLFFFISGFFAYRSLEQWNLKTKIRVIKQKFKAQIICTILFFALLAFFRGYSPLKWLTGGFGGYWFTIVLFQMFILYLFSVFLSQCFKRDIAIILMIFLSMLGIFILMLHVQPTIKIWQILDDANLCLYLQFFTFGLVCKKYKKRFFNHLKSDTIKTTIFIIFTVGMILRHTSLCPSDGSMNKFLSSFVISYFGLLTVLALFTNANEFFENRNFVSNSLCFIGRRSLDIYMLHYFFLPNLSEWHDWLAPNNQILFQLFFGVGITSLIVSICLIISTCIRSSAFLTDWLFGQKKKNN